MLRNLLAKVRPARGAPAATSDGATGTSRRTLISRGLMLFAGAVGAGVAGAGALTPRAVRAPAASAQPASAPAALAQAPSAGPVSLPLFVRNVRFTQPAIKSGTVADGAETRSPYGALVDDEDSPLGTFSGGVLPGSGGQIAVQRFTFADGMLIGMGSGGLQDQEYAVVGGTGRYAGASGSYTTRIQPGDVGRDVEFLITISGTKG